MQIVNETSVAGYVNFMRDVLLSGIGDQGYFGTTPAPGTPADVRFAYLNDQTYPALELTDKPSDFVEDINKRLLYGTMSSTLRKDLTDLISGIKYGDSAGTQFHRLTTALLITLASPEFLVQR